MTETSWLRSDSSCCSTGATLRRAKMSPGRSSTGSRLIVAPAAAVIMLVAPGPIDVVQAKVASRSFMRAKAAAAWTIACSLRLWYVRSPDTCCSAWPTPATLPWPKMAKQPAKKRPSTPSRSTSWRVRNSTSACAMVRRRVAMR